MKKIRQSIRLKFTLMYVFILGVSCLSALVASIVIYLTLYKLEIPHDHTDGIWISLFSLFVCAGVGTVLMFAVTKKISGPITALSEKTKAVARGHFDVSMPVRSIDEIGTLAENFNLMTEALKENELLRKDFISSVSHEFKTPLSAIQGFVEVIKDPDLPREQFEEYTDIILDETQRLSYLVSNMLKLSKLEHQRILNEGKCFSVDEQIRRCLVLLEEKWGKKQIEWQLDLEPTQFCAEEELLSQIWVNLIENAIKFSHQESAIAVNLWVQGKDLVFTIKDQGVGIKATDQERIFERFFQGDSSRTGEGSGLGLSIVKRITELYGGSIGCESTWGNGSIFTVKLPIQRD